MFENIKMAALAIALCAVLFLIALIIYYVVKKIAKLVYSIPVVTKFIWKLMVMFTIPVWVREKIQTFLFFFGNTILAKITPQSGLSYIIILIILLSATTVATAFKRFSLISVCLGLISIVSTAYIYKSSMPNRWVKTELYLQFNYGVMYLLVVLPFAYYEQSPISSGLCYILGLTVFFINLIISKIQPLEKGKVIFLEKIKSHGFQTPVSGASLKELTEKSIRTLTLQNPKDIILENLHQLKNGNFVAGVFYYDQIVTVGFFVVAKLKMKGLSDNLNIEKQYGFKHELKIKGQEVFDEFPEKIQTFFKEFPYNIYFKNGLLLAEFDVTLLPHHDFEANFDRTLKTFIEWES